MSRNFDPCILKEKYFPNLRMEVVMDVIDPDLASAPPSPQRLDRLSITPAIWIASHGLCVEVQRPLLSASQVMTYRDCPRRWAFEYVWNVETEPNESAKLGTAVHAILEQWARHGTPPDRNTRPGKIALKMLGPLPPPGVGYPEKRFYLSTPKHAYTGFIDWPYWDPTHGVTIIDHKTTSNVKWIKTPEILQHDPQALIYAAAGCTAFGVDSVRLLWNYGTTTASPQSYPVSTRISLSDVVQRFASIEATADEIFSLQQAQVNPFSLPPVVSSCEKYGGCPHRQRCNLSPIEKVQAIMNQGQARTNGLLGALSGVSAYVGEGQPQQQQPLPSQPQYTPDPNAGFNPQAMQQPQYGAPQYQQPPAQPQYVPQQQQQQPQYGAPPAGYPQQPQQPQYGAPPANFPPQGYPVPQQQPQYVPDQGYPAPQTGFAAPQPQLGYSPYPQQAPGPQTPTEQQQHAKRPSARRANSPPNSPEGVQPGAAQHAAEVEQDVAAEKKRGRPRKITKGETSLEQQAFLVGVQAGILRGAAPHELRSYGQAAAKAFFEEFPPTSNED